MDLYESRLNKDFDILNWWRVNGEKYSILESLAKDVYAIQVSTVALKSAFSIGGQILDLFRSSLIAKIMEAFDILKKIGLKLLNKLTDSS